MSKIIRVRNDSAKALAEALGRALIAVVTTDNIERILTDRYDTYKYQHVHPRGSGSALGSVNMLTTGKREDFSIVVSMGYGGQYHDRPAAVKALGERGQLRFKVARSLTRVDFTFDEMNHEYCATATVPSRLSKVVTEPKIEFK